MGEQQGKVTPEAIMAASEMRPLLALSKTAPVFCAVGLTAAHEGVVLLHKRLKGEKLMAELRKQAKEVKLSLDAPSLRFGQVSVDAADAKLAKFRLNKQAAGGMEARLKVTLKGSGCTEAEIVVDDSLNEAAPGAPEQVQTDEEPVAKLTRLLQRAQAAIAAQPGRAGTLKPLAAACVAAVRSQEPQRAAGAMGALEDALAAEADPAALRAELATLVPQIAEKRDDAARFETLRGLTATAAAALKSGDSDGAAKAIEAIKAGLSGPAPAHDNVDRTLLEIWRTAKQTVDHGIDALQQACRGFEDGDAETESLLKLIAEKGLHGVTDRAATGLMAAVMDDVETPAGRTHALAAVGDMEGFLAGPVAEMIDENPFDIAIDLRGVLGGAVAAIKAKLAA